MMKSWNRSKEASPFGTRVCVLVQDFRILAQGGEVEEEEEEGDLLELHWESLQSVAHVQWPVC